MKSWKIGIPEDELTDLVFGEWLKSHRNRHQYKLKAVSRMTNISGQRLEELESGSGKGITHKEAMKFSMLYGVGYDVVISMATGGIHCDVQDTLRNKRMH